MNNKINSSACLTSREMGGVGFATVLRIFSMACYSKVFAEQVVTENEGRKQVIIQPQQELSVRKLKSIGGKEIGAGEWGYHSSGKNYRIVLFCDGRKQTLEVYLQAFMPWHEITVENFRVDLKWQEGEQNKLTVKAFEKPGFPDEMRAEIYAMLNHKDIKPRLLAEEE